MAATLDRAPVPVEQVDEFRWEIPQHGPMNVPGRIFANRHLIEDIAADKSLLQVRNVACLPGIVRYSVAMPDIHQGYGFPIGGVAATRLDDGVISPGGVGYDINCGVRLVATELLADQIRPRLDSLVDRLFATIPAGVGAKGGIPRLKPRELERLMQRGAAWAVEHGYGSSHDLAFIEEGGCLEGADPAAVSEHARARGALQVGTLGSGNHFLEVQRVQRVHDQRLAAGLGLFEGQVVYTVHSGSRGFGHQVCTDHIRLMHAAMSRYGIELPDRQLACAPIDSDEGRAYFGAMKCAANYAWVNRQVMMHLADQAFLETFRMGPRELGRRLIYDVCHNIAKLETYPVDGKPTRLCVHRKGATRAMPPHHPLTPAAYQEVGQPVLIPGDMGRASYVLVGTDLAVQESFGSSCHGAGRKLSRTAAKKQVQAHQLIGELASHGILVRARGLKTVSEEAPVAYKDVAEVVSVMEGAGLSRIVARLVPMCVIKG